MTADEFREDHNHGDYTTWTNEDFEKYFALITGTTTPAPATTEKAAA